MKRLAAAQIALLVFLSVPFTAGAETTDVQILYALGTIAALTAQRDRTDLACAVATSPSHIQAGERFSLIWNSVGALSPEESIGRSVFARGGITYLALSSPGTYTYQMSFYSASGSEVTCSTKVVVSA